jgi:hypothetical protein
VEFNEHRFNVGAKSLDQCVKRHRSISTGLSEVQKRTNEATDELLLVPSGGILGIIDLIDCRPMTKADEDGAFFDLFAGAIA